MVFQSIHGDEGYLTYPSNNTIDSRTELDDYYPHEEENASSSSSMEPLVGQRNGASRNFVIKRGGSFTVQADGHTYTYSYGPKGLAGLRHNYYALVCAFFASIGGLDFGYDQGVVRYLLLLISLMLFSFLPFLVSSTELVLDTFVPFDRLRMCLSCRTL